VHEAEIPALDEKATRLVREQKVGTVRFNAKFWGFFASRFIEFFSEARLSKCQVRQLPTMPSHLPST
jgi:hypothetical protein